MSVRDDLLRQMKRRERELPLTDGTVIWIREPALRDRFDAQEAGALDPETGILTSMDMFYAVLAQRCAIDGPGGSLLFTADDIPALANARGKVTRNIPRQIGEAAYQLGEADPDSFRCTHQQADAGGDADSAVRAADGDGAVRDDAAGTRPGDE